MELGKNETHKRTYSEISYSSEDNLCLNEHFDSDLDWSTQEEMSTSSHDQSDDDDCDDEQSRNIVQ